MIQGIRIRNSFAAGFAVLLCVSAFLGLAPQTIPAYKQSDKVLHAVTFFLLTLCFYWIPETSRRRAVHLTLLICTAGLGIGSEVVQGLLPNEREFDPYDILANFLGSGAALALCNWYHRRMLERKRAAKVYGVVPGDDQDADVELGETGRDSEQEVGVAHASAPTVTEELDNWDENAEDWEEGDDATANGKSAPAGGDVKKAID